MKTFVPTLLLLLLLFFPKATTALRCLFQPTRRCGILRLGLTVRIGGAGESCVETCAYLVLSPYECGTCSAEEDDYDIELSFGNSVPQGDQGIFTAAATRWESIVTQGLPAVATDGLAAIEGCDLPITVDDLFICVTYVPFDGVNGTVGGGRTLYSRVVDGLPFVGQVQLDEADSSSLKERGIFDDIVLRSVGRGVGVGIKFPISYGANSTCTYDGTFATSEYQAISGCSSAPPVEGIGNSTICASWSEGCFGTELFTSVNFVENQTKFPLSRMTIAALQDIGYTVDYSQADAYGRADLNPNCTCGSGRWLPTVAKATPPPRRLSSEGHRAAVASGRKLLAKGKEQRALAVGSEQDAASVEYVGDQMVTVFYMENGHIFDVVVRSDD